MVRGVHESRRAVGTERLYVPGEMEADLERRFSAEGIPLNEQCLADIAAVAQARGVAMPAAW